MGLMIQPGTMIAVPGFDQIEHIVWSRDGSELLVFVTGEGVNVWWVALAYRHWVFAAAAGLALAVLAWAIVRVRSRPERPGRRYCRRCGYEIGDTPAGEPPARCSECGRPMAGRRRPVRVGRRAWRRLALPAAAAATLVGGAGTVWALHAADPWIPRMWFDAWLRGPALRAFERNEDLGWLSPGAALFTRMVRVDPDSGEVRGVFAQWTGSMYANEVFGGVEPVVGASGRPDAWAVTSYVGLVLIDARSGRLIRRHVDGIGPIAHRLGDLIGPVGDGKIESVWWAKLRGESAVVSWDWRANTLTEMFRAENPGARRSPIAGVDERIGETVLRFKGADGSPRYAFFYASARRSENIAGPTDSWRILSPTGDVLDERPLPLAEAFRGRLRVVDTTAGPAAVAIETAPPLALHLRTGRVAFAGSALGAGGAAYGPLVAESPVAAWGFLRVPGEEGAVAWAPLGETNSEDVGERSLVFAPSTPAARPLHVEPSPHGRWAAAVVSVSTDPPPGGLGTWKVDRIVFYNTAGLVDPEEAFAPLDLEWFDPEELPDRLTR